MRRAIRLYTLATLLVLVALMALTIYQLAGGKKEAVQSPGARGVATAFPGGEAGVIGETGLRQRPIL